MEFKFQDNTKVGLNEGVDLIKFLANRKAVQAQDIKNLFGQHGYNIQVVPGSFLKTFTMDAKEIHELSLVLEEIDTLEEQKGINLKQVFEANLSIQIFKRVFLERIKKCLNMGIPFINSDNSFVRALYDSSDFEDFVATMPTPEKTQASEVPDTLDEEDSAVKYDILRELGKINENNDDGTLTFVVSSIIANLDNVIKNDNKNYRTLGTRHLIEGALQGISLDPVMQSIVDTQILENFPDQSLNVERGR